MKPPLAQTVLTYLVISIATIVGFVGIIGQLSAPAHAEDAGWLGPNVTGELDKTRPVDDTGNIWPNHTQQCNRQDYWSGDPTRPDKACVFQAKSFQLARVYRCTLDWRWPGSCSPSWWMATGPGESQKIQGLNEGGSDTCWHVVSTSDWIVDACGSDGLDVMKGADISSIRHLQDSKGEIPATGAVAVSTNGEWVVGEIQNYGLFRLHLTDGSVQLFTTNVGQYNYGMNPDYEFSITNDGQYIAVGGWNVGSVIYKVDDSCGVQTTDYRVEWLNLGNNFTACPSKDLGTMLTGANGGVVRFQSISHLRFSDDGQTLSLLEGLRDPVEGAQVWWVKLALLGGTGIPGSGSLPVTPTDPIPVKPPQLKYLALGDSYSSGEGDIAYGSSHYLVGTIGKDECHISDRSYPFLLREHYNIALNDMASVACSGARVTHDYIGNDNNYVGQSGQLKNMQESDKVVARESALSNFAPGIVKQIDFAKKYQPNIITFTGGGNDVGFVNILEYCASAYLGFIPDTCDYANPGSELNKILYDSIDSQYAYDMLFINTLKEVSPDSHIVVVDYPSFIAGGDTGCKLSDAGWLNGSERDMMNNAVHYMNLVLQEVAHDSGVSYVNIENSLDGGRVCEKKDYVNTIADVGADKVKAGDPSVFHPNAVGHEKIADTIIASDVFDHPAIPPAPNFTHRTDLIPTQSAIFTAPVQNISNGTMKVTTEPGQYAANKPTGFTGHSDEVNLGTYITNADGSLTATVPINNMPPGLHVIVANGIGVDGRPVVYYQFVRFIGPTQNTPQSFGEVNVDGYRSTTTEPQSASVYGGSTTKSEVLGSTAPKINLFANGNSKFTHNGKEHTLGIYYLLGALILSSLVLTGAYYVKRRSK